jgi:hypothetical protein
VDRAIPASEKALATTFTTVNDITGDEIHSATDDIVKLSFKILITVVISSRMEMKTDAGKNAQGPRQCHHRSLRSRGSMRGSEYGYPVSKLKSNIFSTSNLLALA